MWMKIFSHKNHSIHINFTVLIVPLRNRREQKIIIENKREGNTHFLISNEKFIEEVITFHSF